MSELVPFTAAPVAAGALSVFSNAESFALAQRMAQALASSDIVPAQYKDNVANCLIALEMSQRIGANPMAVMQNLHIIQGRPSWSSSFIIAALNSCGRYAPLKFDVSGTGDDRGCVAWTTELATGERLDGPRVTIAMAKAEKWTQKPGSKWLTMPELMLRYRAAAFFGRLYAPDVLSGFQSADEVRDVHGEQPAATVRAQVRTETSASIMASLDSELATQAEIVDGELVE